MSDPTPRRDPFAGRRRRPAVVVAGLACALVASQVATALPGNAAASGSATRSSRGLVAGTSPSEAGAAKKAPISKTLAAARGSVEVLVKLQGSTAAQAFAADLAKGRGTASRAAASVEAESASRVASIRPAFARAATKGTVLYTTSHLFPAVAIRTDASRLSAIAALPGVSELLEITPKTRGNARSDQVTRAINTWQSLHDTGVGVTIGVIDTGIDYTHADFGGPGTQAAFDGSDRTHITGDNGEADGDTQFPTDKVVSGYDFAGDAYTGANDPAPDDDPLDCASALGGGHGTHVSGTAAGYGVNADGTTFTGDYSQLTPEAAAAMNIGPGAAPNARLSALRVFGCSGSTSLVTEALDYVAGLDTDDDASNDIQILNLSLGSDFTRGDDPDAQAIDAITGLGVLPVIAAGNAGDLYGAVGSPGSARKALTVAATDDGVDTVDGLRVTTDGTANGGTIYPATNSIAYPYRSNQQDNTGQLVALTDPANSDGCSTFSAADVAAVTGKYAFLEWDDTGVRRCGSAVRSANARKAGALGSVFGSNALRFSAGITGDATIPVTLVNKTGADAIRSALQAGTTVTGTFGFNYRAGTPLGAKIVDLASTDKLADFSSRGGTPVDGYLKPDVGAPGLHTFSANSGTGNEGLDDSGTSMATPHTAGTAALVLAAHPLFTPEELKAAVINTASGVLTTDGQGKGTEYGVSRVGAGRIDGLDASSTNVVAFVQNDPGAVGLGFGPVEASAPTTRTKTVEVENYGTAAVTYALSYASAEDVPGVTFDLPASVTVPAATATAPGTATYVVTMSISDVAALRKVVDPTVDLTTSGVPRVDVAEENGRILMTPSAGIQLRLPAAVAARPVSVMHSAAAVTTGPGTGSVTSGTLNLTGTPLNNGALGSATSYAGLVAPLQLQATSPSLNACTPTQIDGCINFPSQRAGDLHQVGATSTVPTAGADGLVGIGLTTYGNWIQPAYNPGASGVGGEMAYYVLIDTDGNGSPDREIDVTRLAASTDIYVAETYDYATGEVLDDEPLNSVTGDTDTGIINSNGMVLPVTLGALGLPTGRTTISYTVYTQSLDDNGSTVDTVGPLSFDVAHPELSVAPGVKDTLLSQDVPSALKVRKDTTVPGQQDLGLLLLHLHNSSAQRGEVVGVQDAADPGLSTFTPVDPVRVLDTRTLKTGAVGAGKYVDLTVTGANGVPADASVVALNVTAVAPTAASVVRVFPTPTTGSALGADGAITTRKGVTQASTMLVRVGKGGAVRLYNTSGSTQLLADLAGYYVKNGQGAATVAVQPSRLLDTRTTTGGNKGAVVAQHPIDLTVAGVGGVPADATAVVLDLTSVNPTAAGNVRVYPTPASGSVVPTVSALNADKGVLTSNLVITKIGSGGKVRLWTSAGSTNLLADVAGYYEPTSTSADARGEFVSLASTRVYDTRKGSPVASAAAPLGTGKVAAVPVAGAYGVPTDAAGVLLRFSALNGKGTPNLQVYSGSGTVPVVTSLTTRAGLTASQLVLVPLVDGTFRVHNSGGATDLAADLEGYTLAGPSPLSASPSPSASPSVTPVP